MNHKVQLSFYSIRVHLLEYEPLAVWMIRGIDFIDKFVQAGWPGDKAVELEVRTTIPILHRGLRAQHRLQQKNMKTTLDSTKAKNRHLR